MSNLVFIFLILTFFQRLPVVQGQMLRDCIIQKQVQPGRSTAEQNHLALALLSLLGIVTVSEI